tara:strand:- start:966 stop:1760 length:795 start_codon:yes stop_codon:yes gene_type:complete
MNKEEVAIAINNYYKLKGDYENSFYKQKLRIIKNDVLNKQQKRAQFNRIRKKCINCKRPGGTVFSDKGRVLKAVCGNAERPCKLNIEIAKGEYIQITDMKDIIYGDLEKNKMEIIKTKLNYLFGYITEDEVSDKFEEAKADYTGDKTIYTSLEKKDQAAKNQNKEQQHELRRQFYLYVDEFRKIMKMYYSENKATLLKDANEVYLSYILPISEQLRENKYRLMQVEYNEDDETYLLVQNLHTLEDTEIPLGGDNTSAKVVFNNY